MKNEFNPAFLFLGLAVAILLYLVGSQMGGVSTDTVKDLFVPKPLSVGIAVDMTGSANNPPYKEAANRVVQSTLRQLQKGDRVSVYRICGYTETIVNMVLHDRLTDQQLVHYSNAALLPCPDRGSAITGTLTKMMNNGHNAIMFFSDGGLADDPERDKFRTQALQLSNQRAVLFAGLAGTRRERQTMRDSLASQLPMLPHIYSAGMVDESPNFTQFAADLNKARR